jgi:nicotinic acid mononucleotide adenylyltransferase
MPKTTGKTTFRNAVLRHAPYGKKPSTMATAKEQKIIFTIARMNPPTPGHMMLVKTLIKEAGKNKVYILLQAGLGAGKEKKNPLTCGEKKRYLLEMIESLDPIGKNVEVVCADDELDKDCTQSSDPLRQICDIYKREKYNPEKETTFYLWVGTDRVESFKKFLGNVKYLPPNSKLITNELARPEGGISGTKMRELARNKDEDEKKKIQRVIIA